MWKQYLEGMLNVSEERHDGNYNDIFQKAYQNITREKVEKGNKKLKAGKTAGLDRVATKYLKIHHVVICSSGGG